MLFRSSASVHMQAQLQNRHIGYFGPFDNLKSAVISAFEHAEAGDVVLFSPGATSFGMFLNEFDRGRCFKALVEDLPVSRE